MTPALLLTRPRPEAERFLRALPRPPDVLVSPLIEIVPVPVSLPGDVAGLILTSANGVRAAAALDLPPGLPAWCVGQRTTAAATAAGFRATYAGPDAEGLVRHLVAAKPQAPLLHLHGRHTRGEIAARLGAAGQQVETRIAYDQIARPLTDAARARLARPDPVVAPLFSPRTATLLAQEGPFAAPLTVAALSPAVAEAAQALSPRALLIAPRPDAASLAELTTRALQQGNGWEPFA